MQALDCPLPLLLFTHSGTPLGGGWVEKTPPAFLRLDLNKENTLEFLKVFA